jgi:hypothetical protein
MLQSQLTNCSGESNIPLLLDEINCKLYKLGTSLYGNTVFLLNNDVSAEEIIDLIIYRRILTFRQVNPDYCSDEDNNTNILIYN